MFLRKTPRFCPGVFLLGYYLIFTIPLREGEGVAAEVGTDEVLVVDGGSACGVVGIGVIGVSSAIR